LRYAVYFTPAADDPLTDAASRWLGRNAFSLEEGERPDGLPFPAAQWTSLVAEPRRYGFHATLKAPFELNTKRSEDELLAAFDDFCAHTPSFQIPKVVIGQLGSFFALVPYLLHPPLQDFAAAVVETFESFRAPLSEADIARRRPERLTEAQRGNLMRWGYPYVMDEFRFHMTLTGPVEPGLAPLVRETLEERFAAFIKAPLPISGLALFVEPERGAPFNVCRWKPLDRQASA